MTPEWKGFLASMAASVAVVWVFDRLDAKYGITAAHQRAWRELFIALRGWLRR